LFDFICRLRNINIRFCHFSYDQVLSIKRILCFLAFILLPILISISNAADVELLLKWRFLIIVHDFRLLCKTTVFAAIILSKFPSLMLLPLFIVVLVLLGRFISWIHISSNRAIICCRRLIGPKRCHWLMNRKRVWSLKGVFFDGCHLNYNLNKRFLKYNKS